MIKVTEIKTIRAMESYFCCFDFGEDTDDEKSKKEPPTDEKIANDMKIHLYVPRNYEEFKEKLDFEPCFKQFFSCCPTCRTWSDGNVAIDDYVDHAMIWCNKCNAHIFLLNKTAKVVTKKYIEDKNPAYFANLTDEQKRTFDDPQNKFVSVQNAFIKKLTDSRLSRFASEKQLSSAESSQFSEDLGSMYGKTDEFFEQFVQKNPIAVKYGIKYRGSDNDYNDNDYNDNSCTYDKKILNISVDVNSYDLEKPRIRYVKSIDTSHGGIYLYVMCEDENKKEFYSRLWGC